MCQSQILKQLADIPEDYICSLCRKDDERDDEKFDFLMGMERLKRVGPIFIISYKVFLSCNEGFRYFHFYI